MYFGTRDMRAAKTIKNRIYIIFKSYDFKNNKYLYTTLFVRLGVYVTKTFILVHIKPMTSTYRNYARKL